MLFRFRVCQDNDLPDAAQGWVVALSEMQARDLLGGNAYLDRMPAVPLDIAVGTVIFTDGALDSLPPLQA